jgi:hypothetical protein
LKEIGDVFGLLPNVGTLIFPIFVDILELFEGFDDIDVIPEIYDHVL